MVPLKAADRNIEVMKPYLDKAAATGRSQVAAIGVAQEMQRVLIARQRRGLSNNGTASGDSGLRTAGLPSLAVRMGLTVRPVDQVESSATSSISMAWTPGASFSGP